MDGGCSVEGYQSDITRTFVFGKPTQRQGEIWNLDRKSQDAGYRTAQIGAPCEAVDAASRKVIYGEFGMRLEDVAYITPQGPKFFTNQSPSIDKPFG